MFERLKRRKIFKYLERFGLIYGLWIFYLVRRSTKEVVQFKLPAFEQLITLRRRHSDIVIFEEIFIEEIYKIGVEQRIETIIDAGANVGLASLYFLYKYQPKLLICIEPNEENFKQLTFNLSKSKGIIFYKKALWHSESLLKFKSLDADSWAFEVLETSIPEEAEVSATSLTQLIVENQLTSIDLLKIDIEGSEKEVFSINNEWVNLVKNAIVEVHDNMRPGAEQAVFTLLSPQMEITSSYQDNFVFKRKNNID